MHFLSSHLEASLGGTLFLGLLAMVLHEFGHLFTSWLVGIKVKRFGLCLRGMYIVREAGTPAKNLLISVAGPLTNVVLILLFWRASHMFALANLCLAVCNLAPIKGSDGDRALGCLQQIQKELAPATESN